MEIEDKMISDSISQTSEVVKEITEVANKTKQKNSFI